MKFYNVKLLTVICEILAQKNILDILAKHKISGYTTFEVEGNGSRGLRGQGLKNEEIARTLFTNFAIVLYVSDVGVLRTEKFN